MTTLPGDLELVNCPETSTTVSLPLGEVLLIACDKGTIIELHDKRLQTFSLNTYSQERLKKGFHGEQVRRRTITHF